MPTPSKQGTQSRAAVARPDNAIRVFAGDDRGKVAYAHPGWLWPDSSTTPEPEEVAEAVASFGKQRADD